LSDKLDAAVAGASAGAVILTCLPVQLISFLAQITHTDPTDKV
jgi:Flp pilus assembly protein TadB